MNRNAVNNSGHGGHSGGVFNATAGHYDTNPKDWGDILPGNDADGLVYNGSGSGLNWTTAGKAVFAAHCGAMTAKQFYDVQIAAGIPQADVLTDLNSQAANEDLALLAAIGGTFTAANVATWDTAVSATTDAASGVSQTATTLNGTLKTGSKAMASGFEWGTSATLATFTTESATPTSVTNAQAAVSKALSGLTAGTTYYYRVTGTTDAGLDTEGVTYGAILTFTTSAATGTAQTITFPQPPDMALGGGTQSAGATATSGLAVTYVSNDTAVCTIAADGTITAVGDGTCSITASQAGDGTFAAASRLTRTFAVTAVARTLTIDARSFTAGGYVGTEAPPTITSTASAGTGTKTYSSTTTSVCTIGAATGVVTFVAPGTCTIGATIAAAGTHGTATAPSIGFPVTAAARTVTIDADSFTAAGHALGGNGPTITSTPSAGAGTKTYSSSTTSVCTVDAATGVVTLVDTGTCTIAAAIAAAGIYGTATATSVSFPVTATASLVTPTTSTTTPSPTTTTPPTTAPPTTAPPTTTPPTTTPPTTTPPTSPFPGAPPANAGEGAGAGVDAAVRGVVWFDRNRNAAFDGREWVLPGVEVTLTQVLSTTAEVAAAGADFAAAAGPISVTVRTAPDGSYLIPGLPPGKYTVRATAAIRGFDYTSDSSGDADWSVEVTIPANQVGVAEFAGLGRGELAGKMYETGTRRGMAFASITCRWGGYDDVLGTADDVPFVVSAAADGTFDMGGVPYGNFSCSGVDDEGRTAEAPMVSVFSPETVFADLPVSQPSGMLPNTGSELLQLALLGAALLVAGGILRGPGLDRLSRGCAGRSRRSAATR